MTDPSLQWIHGDVPTLERPVLIVMLTGWIDAGAAATAAMAAIVEETGAETVAVLDEDTYIDFRARRPTMELRDGLNTVVDWSRITLATATDRTGRPLLLLSGPEPDLAWHRFCEVIGEVATALDVSQMVSLGAYPFTAPHTRPSRISLTTPSPDVLASMPFLRSSVDVPAGVAAALEHTMHGLGIPAIGLWAQVPHYIATAPYPAASVALLDALRIAAEVVVDAASLRHEVIAQRRRLDEMIANNEDHQRLLAQLEQLHDAAPEQVDTTATPPTSGLEMRSGDELAAELERFLRDQE